MSLKPLALIILDGWGYRQETKDNAVALAKTPVFDSIFQKSPTSFLEACGEAVGLPEGVIGNSEVGHMNIGSGRILYQDLSRINHSIRSKDFFQNQVLRKMFSTVKANGRALHLMGLLSDGGVHSHISHLFALLDFAKEAGLSKVFVHCFMDGRDTSPCAGKKYLSALEDRCRKVGNAKIATVIGRFYAMDRDQRWERIKAAYEALVMGKGEKAASSSEAIERAYKADTTDEFLLPTVIMEKGHPIGSLQEEDAVLFFNFRADRARELTSALNFPDFNHFERKRLVHFSSFVTMTKYQASYPFENVFQPQNLENVFGEVIAAHGLKQFRIAETEKYAHVTYFFNGGREVQFQNEDRKLIPSSRDVATYDLKPEMSAAEVTDEIIQGLDSKQYDVLIINFANPDMVGHSGVLKAAIKAVTKVDYCLGRVLKKINEQEGVALVTADHGNCEMMANPDGSPHTSHTLNLVPLILVGDRFRGATIKNGRLSDLAPTMLAILGIPQPKEMTGESLIV